MCKVAVIGYGVVGSGTVELFMKNRESISKKVGKECDIKYILDLRDFPDSPFADKMIKDFNIILNDAEVEVVAEVVGGTTFAYDYTKKLLEHSKSVVTSNKALVAEKGAELLKIAREHNCNYLFEASVGGGIPIIRPLNQSLTADEITEITGILNGTTNYILSKMTDEGKSFEEVLKRAQEKGYAERNPEADVEGYDACRKIAILTSLALGKQVDYQDIYTEGITKITKTDIEYAKVLHASIKLLGTSKWEDDGKIYSMVAPFMIDSDHPLGHVNGVFNGIFVNGNMLGDTMFYGKGAGKLPTASAVVADVVDAVKHQGTNIMTIWEQDKVELGDRANFACRFFVRVADTTSKETIEKVFGEVEYVTLADVSGEYAFLTDKLTEGAFEEKSKQVDMIMRIRTAL